MKNDNKVYIKKGQNLDFQFIEAIKKPIPVKCFEMKEAFIIETIEGDMEGKAGDFLMVGIEGEMYPCDRRIFEKTYDIIKKEE